MSARVTCPHCESRDIEPKPVTADEQQSGVAWYQCLRCRRMWSDQRPPPPVNRENDNSPESN